MINDLALSSLFCTPVMTTPVFRVNRFVWLIAGVATVGFFLYMIRGAIFPFMVGGALAYVLHPLVSAVEKRMPWRDERPGLTRLLSILIAFIAVIGLITGGLIIVIPPLTEQFGQFIDGLPDLISQARGTVEGWNRDFSSAIPEEIRLQVEDALANAGTILVSATQNFVLRTIGAVSQALTLVIGLAAVPIFLYYVLKDREKIVEGLVSVFPPEPRVHARNVITILNRVFSSYVRAQMFLGLVVGTTVFVGLFLLGVQFSVILGVAAGVFELVPIIGPWLGAIPGIVVVLATAPEKFLWVVLLYFGIQLLENSFLVPRIQSRALNVHPIMILVVLIVGSEVAGLWGIILGPPLAVAAKEVFDYFSAEWHSEEGLPLSESEHNIEHLLGNEHHSAGTQVEQASEKVTIVTEEITVVTTETTNDPE